MDVEQVLLNGSAEATRFNLRASVESIRHLKCELTLAVDAASSLLLVLVQYCARAVFPVKCVKHVILILFLVEVSVAPEQIHSMNVERVTFSRLLINSGFCYP